MKKREISDSDTNEIQSEKLKVKSVFPKIFSMHRFNFLCRLKFMLICLL